MESKKKTTIDHRRTQSLAIILGAFPPLLHWKPIEDFFFHRAVSNGHLQVPSATCASPPNWQCKPLPHTSHHHQALQDPLPFWRRDLPPTNIIDHMWTTSLRLNCSPFLPYDASGVAARQPLHTWFPRWHSLRFVCVLLSHFTPLQLDFWFLLMKNCLACTALHHMLRDHAPTWRDKEMLSHL
jgi:hypothetical protein